MKDKVASEKDIAKPAPRAQSAGNMRQTMQRRRFLQTVTGSACALGMSSLAGTLQAAKVQPHDDVNQGHALSNQQRPLAIAMWDFSWILRHQRLDAFENWDRVLDGLVERGYNAIRIDALPNLVAPDAQGRTVEEYFFAKDNWSPGLWANDYSIRIRPREALLEFLPKCYQRGIHVGLSTWFIGKEKRFPDGDGLYRAWDGTLALLDQHGLLDRLLYVDVLNEYPLWHGYDWLRDELNARADAATFRAKKPDAHVADADAFVKKGAFTLAQKQFFNDFLNNLLTRLKQKRPKLDYLASLDANMPLEDIDLSKCGAMDYHVWFNQHPEVSRIIEHVNIPGPNDIRFEQMQKTLTAFWQKNRKRMIDWISGRIKAIAARAAQNHLPCGNTEGWGAINWLDHPALNWDFTKEAGEICVDLALANGYKFICTSNFTHPQFRGLWNDVKWHQKLTSQIRNA
jgi:hypothetical protein